MNCPKCLKEALQVFYCIECGAFNAIEFQEGCVTIHTIGLQKLDKKEKR